MRVAKPLELSVLFLDDSSDLVAHYKSRLERRKEFRVTGETESTRARKLAMTQLFDVLVIDAKLEYRGFEFGGLRLADDLADRYGRHSIVVISRYITSTMAQMNELHAEFLEKRTAAGRDGFDAELRHKILEMQSRQYVFVAMPFDRRHDALFEQIKLGAGRAGLSCVRVDEVPHNRSINEVIYEAIGGCKLVVFLADGGSANAYYEAGFADAMHKEVIIVAHSTSELKFDVANRNCILYGDEFDQLAGRIEERITALRLRHPILV